MKKRVALISGGEGYEHGISERSAEGLFPLIDKKHYEIYCIHITESGEWYISPRSCKKYKNYPKSSKSFRQTFPVMLDGKSGFLLDGEVLEIDCAIPSLHGDFGEDGKIQGALSTAHIPFIGEDVYSCAVSSDKAYTKIIAESVGIPTAKWIVTDALTPAEAKRKAEEKIGYPMFIKPARLGSSYGARPILSECDFTTAYEYARSFDKRIIIEELVDFEYELECALLGGDDPLIIPGGMIISGGAFYDFTSKYEKKFSPETAIKTDGFSDSEQKAKDYCSKLADAIGIKQLARIDFFVCWDGRLVFNEINPFPGMTKTSLYPRLLAKTLKKESFVDRLLESRLL